MSNAKALVLIVEDEPEIAELIEFHAERAGMHARKVHSGRIALDVIKREKPDLIVLDLMLPDIDGLEVCRRLKQSDDTRMIPIVMVTAKGEEADIVAGIELGADDYVTKPFSPRVLMARLRNVLRRNGVVIRIQKRSWLALTHGVLKRLLKKQLACLHLLFGTSICGHLRLLVIA